MPTVGSGIHPDGKKLGPQISSSCLLQVNVAFAGRGDAFDIEIFIQEALRRIGVGIYYDRRIVNAARLRRNRRAVALSKAKNTTKQNWEKAGGSGEHELSFYTGRLPVFRTGECIPDAC